jgi:hypothetical protein
LNIVGLCLFIGLTLYANNEDFFLLINDVNKHQAEVIYNMNMYAEPIYYKVIKDASTKYALDPNLIATIIYVESRGNVLAVSPRGAKGQSWSGKTGQVHKWINCSTMNPRRDIV